ncbi:MAG: hypothetical protein AAGA66_07250 [Bacteroidota bacterium]
MKRFKLIFHIIYVIIALVVMYFSIDVLINTEQYLSKIKLSSYIRFPRYIMIVFLILSLVMMIEFVLERLNVHRIKGGIRDLEKEVISLKAKLYDQSQQALPQDTDIPVVLEEEDAPEDDPDSHKEQEN